MNKMVYVPDLYESPKIVVEKIESEGCLCSSGTHAPFTEDDSWIEYLE